MDPEDTNFEASDSTIDGSGDSTIGTSDLIEHVVGVRLPVEIGNFHLHLYTDLDEKEHLALVKGNPRGKSSVLTRIHSECLTGDLFGSLRCDCGPQLRQAMKIIEEEGEGLVIYLRQEGRGIGLAEKLKAYNLQDQGFDTVDANLKLGHRGEERDYEVAARILSDLGIDSIRLMSNNPAKVRSLNDHGIEVDSLVPMNPPVTEENLRYLETKVERMDHRIDFNHLSPSTPEREEILRFVKRSLEVREGSGGGKGEVKPATGTEPYVTLSYFQGLEGCVATTDPSSVAGYRENLLLKGQLRELHDAYLTNNTSFLSLESLLAELFPNGFEGLPVILDPDLIVPPESFPILTKTDGEPVSSDTDEMGEDEDIPPQAVLLIRNVGTEEQWASYLERNIMVLPIVNDTYQVDIPALMGVLTDLGINSIVVEGPQDAVTAFINDRDADLIVSTVLPCFFGSGTECTGSHGPEGLKGDYCMDGFRFNKLSGELVYYGRPDWKMK
jgi:GTP cyclohydrolase II